MILIIFFVMKVIYKAAAEWYNVKINKPRK